MYEPAGGHRTRVDYQARHVLVTVETKRSAEVRAKRWAPPADPETLRRMKAALDRL
ncbi:MAG: hypothetical protein ACRDPY_10770 [Streptosporangiaceae bacterium]